MQNHLVYRLVLFGALIVESPIGHFESVPTAFKIFFQVFLFLVALQSNFGTVNLLAMSANIKLKKGFDINLAGKAEKKIVSSELSDTFCIKPTDFIGMERPKVLVNVGDTVKAGTPIMLDKKLEKVIYASPVSGEVVEIVRGEKRKLLGIKILADKKIEYVEFPRLSVSDLQHVTHEQALERMLASGVWPNIVQRPYGIVANPDDAPKAIFISAFDTHPLAPDYDFIFKGQEKYFQAGIDILKKFTKGTIHVNVNGNGEISAVFGNTQRVQINKVSGKHPAGNVGVQIHHLDPINKGDIVWTLNPHGVIQIGKLFLEGCYDAPKVIALAGSEVTEPAYYQTYVGACVDKLLKGKLKSAPANLRVISGNVLTGEQIAADGYMGFYDHLLTVIPEGNHPRFFLTDGWLAPTAKRLSFHRALGLLSFLTPKKEFALDTSTNGEERAFVMSGTFESIVPMDIYPTHLLKAIMAEDFDEMEALGIYEVIEEDLALCEFVDVSKHKVQQMVREGLDLIRKA